jgi:2-polyprenyl-3-methyl-5-hydroxy-6-metoxy-1,4-benzoquinol methylase
MSEPRIASEGPAAIFQMFQAAQATAILTAGVQLGVFAALAGGARRSAAEVGERVRCPPRSTRILLDALAVVGLIEKERDVYQLGPLAEEHLVPGKPMYVGDLAGIFGNPMIWTGMSRLSEAVRSGGTILSEHAETPKNPFWETFAQSSASMAFPAAGALEAIVGDFLASKPKARVLDIAAGSGIYGYTLAKRANVELTLLDWPNVLAQTREWGKRLGAQMERVRFVEGNLFEVDYRGPYELILLSHVYHHFDPETCLSLTRKVAGALAPGGRVAVQDFVSSPDLSNPAATMFSIVMLAWTTKGEAYTEADYSGWFTACGLKAPSAHPIVGLPTSWLVTA